MTALLRCEGVYVSHRSGDERLARGEPLRAVDGVSLELAPGEILGLVGESGCGKSSLARALALLGEVEAGRIWQDGEEVSRLPMSRLKRFRRQVQLLFQDSNSALDPRWSVGRAIAEPLRVQGICGRGSEEQETRRRLLASVRLSADLEDRFPHQLSGGERQRVALARALACEPQVLIADEPWSGLDAATQVEMANLLLALRKQRGLACLLVSHDLRLLGRVADRVAVMYLGKLVEVGPAADVSRGPCHPYARALWNAARWTGSVPFAANAPSARLRPAGCRFHPRCPASTERCRNLEPAPSHIGAEHVVSCFHPCDDEPASADLDVSLPRR